MGQVALPEMRKCGYSGALATGTLAAGGTLGVLVPPSIPLVVYAILTEQTSRSCLALIVVELGLIHPPVGLNVYVIHNIAGNVSTLETFKGVGPFLIAEFFRVSLLIAFPFLVLVR